MTKHTWQQAPRPVWPDPRRTARDSLPCAGASVRRPLRRASRRAHVTSWRAEPARCDALRNLNMSPPVSAMMVFEPMLPLSVRTPRTRNQVSARPTRFHPPTQRRSRRPSHLLHSRWPLTSVRRACACMDQRNGTESRRSIGEGTCPRCGHALSQTGRGRPRVWCSQTCRRAAYEERRAAAAGAIGIEVIRQTIVEEHPLSICVDRTIASPVGCRRVLAELTKLMFAGGLRSDPKWSVANSAVESLIAAARPTTERRC